MEFTPLTDKQKSILHNIYYNQKMFFGRDRLYNYIKSNYKDIHISRRGIQDWLNNQNISQLFHPVKKTTEIRRTLTKSPNNQVGLDLMDMSNREYNGYKWILTAIDMFSKMAYAIALKDKEGTTVRDGMANILKQMKELPKSVRSDNGSEFKDNEFQTLLNKHDIKQIFSLPSKPQSNGQIERFNGVLKRLIEMYIKYSDDNNWVKVLPTLLNNYNNTISRITKFTPNEINENDPNILKEVKENIETHITQNNKSDLPLFNIGDKVRIKLYKNELGNKSFENWSSDIYVISKVRNHRATSVYKTSYKLTNEKGDNIKGIFYNDDLQLIKSVQNPIKAPVKYIVKKLIKLTIKNNIPYYLVQWKGYKEHTLEKRSEIIKDIPKIIAKYEKINNINI